MTRQENFKYVQAVLIGEIYETEREFGVQIKENQVMFYSIANKLSYYNDYCINDALKKFRKLLNEEVSSIIEERYIPRFLVQEIRQ